MTKKYKVLKPYLGFGQDIPHHSQDDLVKQGFDKHEAEYCLSDCSPQVRLVGLYTAKFLKSICDFDDQGGVPESLDAKCLELFGCKYREWVNYQYEMFWRGMSCDQGLLDDPLAYVPYKEIDGIRMSFSREDYKRFLEILDKETTTKNHHAFLEYLFDRGYVDKPTPKQVRDIHGEL